MDARVSKAYRTAGRQSAKQAISQLYYILLYCGMHLLAAELLMQRMSGTGTMLVACVQGFLLTPIYDVCFFGFFFFFEEVDLTTHIKRADRLWWRTI